MNRLRLTLLAFTVWFVVIHPVHASPKIHVVEPGEQVGRLAFLYEVSADEILAANPLLTLPLEAGQRVVIPGSPVSEAAPPLETLEEAPIPPPPAPSAPPTEPQPRSQLPSPTGSSSAAIAAAIAGPASQGIRYNGRWTPPGESSAWNMDCSNAARWLTRKTRGIELPRTASGQYEWLRARKKLWRVRPNPKALKRVLRPGDLLFWEHTYRPVRKPPVTHVMVYLGTDSNGRMRMAGSQGSRGVSTYNFDPSLKMGSYPFFLWFRRDGRFVAYGRP